MNIYKRKAQWKLGLIIMAMLMIGGSFWYTSVIVKKIAKDERAKITIWADAISKRAQLVHYTSHLFDKLGDEEKKKVSIWAKALKELPRLPDEAVSIVLEVVKNNNTVPMIQTDELGYIISWRNLEPGLEPVESDSIQLYNELSRMKEAGTPIQLPIYDSKGVLLYHRLIYSRESMIIRDLRHTMGVIVENFISEIEHNSASVPVLYTNTDASKVLAYGNLDSASVHDSLERRLLIEEMISHNEPIKVELEDGVVNYIYYKDSYLLTQLQLYPVIQLIAIGLFLGISYFLFNLARRSEQNQVWVGMAKETAHQLGTPLTSLMGWVTYLKDKDVDQSVIVELEKDVNRLNTVTERFSKIGAIPELKAVELSSVLVPTTNYLRSRIPQKIQLTLDYPENEVIETKLNKPLFEWVIENICKNAVDAMTGNKSKSNFISVTVTPKKEEIIIDIADSGKGIPKSQHRMVFQPGYTTKKRGWGLGLSLVKRIVQDYHAGKIFVKSSEPNQGTTFRIILKRHISG